MTSTPEQDAATEAAAAAKLAADSKTVAADEAALEAAADQMATDTTAAETALATSQAQTAAADTELAASEATVSADTATITTDAAEIAKLEGEVPTPTPTPVTPTPATTGTVTWGTFSASGSEAVNAAFMDTLNLAPADCVSMDFFDRTTWEKAADSIDNWLGAAWAAWPGRMCWAIPMLIDTDTSDDFSAVTAGTNDTYYEQMATQIATFTGTTKAAPIIRMAWEFNLGVGGSVSGVAIGGAPTPAVAAAFVAGWQHIHGVMAPLLPAGTEWLWNPTSGTSATMSTADLEACYPGDAYVDVVGVDLYNDYWSEWPGDTAFWADATTSSPSLTWLASFAGAHTKTAALPEWALWPADSTSNQSDSPGDDPTFVTNVLAWIKATNAAGVDVLSLPWNDESSPWSNFPESYAALKAGIAAA